jgi:hypothetical protein
MSDKQLDERQLESRKEVIIPIKLRELYKAYAKGVYDKPIDLVKGIARKVDDFSVAKRMRTGLLAVVTMPLGIITRNASRAAHYVAEEKFPGAAGGVVGAAAAWWFAGKMAFTWATTQAPVIAGIASQAGVLGAVAKIGTLVATTALTGLAVLPVAFMVGTVATAVAGAAVIGALSTVPAAFNLKTGFLRTLDRIRGIKGVDYDGAKEEQEISYNSLSARNERKEYSQISWKIRGLTDDHQKEIFDKLKEKFDAAAAANQNQPQPVAQPAAAPSAPKATP